MKELRAVIAVTDEERRNHSNTHQFVTADGMFTHEGKLLVELAIEVLTTACFRNADAHGWYDWLGTDENPKAELVQRNFGEVIALIHSELSEALESYRDSEPELWYEFKDKETPFDPERFSDAGDVVELGKPQGVATELADVLIRIFDTVHAMGLPLSEALIRKHTYNYTRPYRHGGKRA